MRREQCFFERFINESWLPYHFSLSTHLIPGEHCVEDCFEVSVHSWLVIIAQIIPAVAASLLV